LRPPTIPSMRVAKEGSRRGTVHQTQLIYNVPRFREFRARIVDLGLHERVAILAGVGPIRSLRRRSSSRTKVAGMDVPETIVRAHGGPFQRDQAKAGSISVVRSHRRSARSRACAACTSWPWVARVDPGDRELSWACTHVRPRSARRAKSRRGDAWIRTRLPFRLRIGVIWTRRGSQSWSLTAAVGTERGQSTPEPFADFGGERDRRGSWSPVCLHRP
jgi:hypothetical protein